MIRPILKYARTPLVVLAGASLIAGCADLKSGMNRIQDSIAEAGTKRTDEGESGKQSREADTAEAESSTQKKAVLNCPDIEMIDNLGTLHKFTNMSPPEDKKRISTARLISLKHDCRMTDQGKGQVDLFMTFESNTGPAAQTVYESNQEISYPYFVAVTDKEGTILSKDVFELAITPSANTGVITARESIRQIIPVAHSGELEDYNIAIGFQMSDAQLEYNRKNTSETGIRKPESLAPDQGNRASEDAEEMRNMDR